MRLDQEIHIWCRTLAIKLNDLHVLPIQEPTSIQKPCKQEVALPVHLGEPHFLRQALTTRVSGESEEADPEQLNSYRVPRYHHSLCPKFSGHSGSHRPIGRICPGLRGSEGHFTFPLPSQRAQQAGKVCIQQLLNRRWK